MVPFQGWNPYQAPVSPAASLNTQPAVGAGPHYTINPHLSPPVSSYAGSHHSMPSSTGPVSSSKKEDAFPKSVGPWG